MNGGPAALLAALLAFGGVALDLLVSDSLLLTLGIPYNVPGGSYVWKIHPGSYLLMLAFVVLAVPANPVRLVVATARRVPAAGFYGVTVAGLFAYVTVNHGFSGSAFVLETLLMPLVAALLLLHLPERHRALLFAGVVVLVTVNALLGIAEAVSGDRLVPYLAGGEPVFERHFRATALGGHPLNNALITATVLFATVLVLRGRPVLGALALLVQAAALLAFGSRVAFVVVGGFGAVWLTVWAASSVLRMRDGVRGAVGHSLVLLLIPVLAAVAVVGLGLGERIFSSFFLDASARTRIVAFRAFALVSAPELWFGIGPVGVERVLAFLRRAQGLSDAIENFWVLWVLNFGLIGFAPLAATLLWFVRSLLRGAPAALWVSALSFLLIASSNNSLGSKDRALVVLVVVLIGGLSWHRRVRAEPEGAPAPAPAGNGRRLAGAALGVLLALFMAAGAVGDARAADAPPIRRGVNLSHWLQYGGRQPVTADDLAAIRAAGFDHVRLPFDPVRLGWSPDAPLARPRHLHLLDAAVRDILAAGLAVILDFHPAEAARARIEREPAAQDGFVAFWRALAERYRDHPAERVLFEPLNEPQFPRRAAVWNDLKGRLLAAVRDVDRTRWVLLSSVDAVTIMDQLNAGRVFRDARVAYVVHFYEPHLITHFGANWGAASRPPESQITALAYPSYRTDPAAVAILPGPETAAARALVRDYAAQPWDAARLDRLVAGIAAWGRAHGVPVVCTEFGVLRRKLPPESRRAWLTDARTALERHGIPWTVWDYADVFGIATSVGSVELWRDGAVVPADPKAIRRAFDPDALAALGLR
ncbi:MAG TPA: VpsF family polysaccharide biosynthesis protein [Azospirillum sp.]